MNWLIARLKEPSTKRGIIWLIAGVAVICGYELSPEKIEQWIGIAMMIAGLLGWLPDEQPKKVVDYTGPARSDDHYRDPAESRHAAPTARVTDHHSVRVQSVQSSGDAQDESAESNQPGWNG